MSSLWPLMQEELHRLLPQLRGFSNRLALANDATAAAQWHRRLQAFLGATRALGDTPLPAFIGAMLPIWSDGRQRAQQTRRAIESLDALEALADLDGNSLATGFDRLRAILESTPAAIRGVDEAGDPRLLALFATEVEEKCAVMDRMLLQLEQQRDRLELIAPLMRAAHSIKGAARAVRNEIAVSLAHALEDLMSGAQRSPPPVDEALVDIALRTVDQLRALGHDRSADALAAARDLIRRLRAFIPGTTAAAQAPLANVDASTYIHVEETDPILRVRASHVGKLIALAGTGMVENRRLKPFGERQQRLRRELGQVSRLLDDLHHQLGAPSSKSGVGAQLAYIRHELSESRHEVNNWLEAFGAYQRESFDLNERLYHHATMTRLRPFSDIASGYPRMVRDIARQLGKRARAVLEGSQAAVDRDVLERLDAPLVHLLRNAIDHGIESPGQRRDAGKTEEGSIRIGVTYRAGMLAIDVSDDGAGIDYERIRAKLVSEGRMAQADADELDEEALGEVLFGTGFSTREQVSEISGRGVGLDVVRQMLKELEGSVRLSSTRGFGTRFSLLVPISRAVTRAVVVSVAGEAYAFPLLRIERLVRSDRDGVQAGKGMQYLALDGQNIGLVPLAEQLDLGESQVRGDHVDVVVVSQEGRRAGFVVDAVLGEFDLATRPLDPRLGRVTDLASLALLPDGAPVVMLDVEDLMHGALDRERKLARLRESEGPSAVQRKRRVLVVDDSISVRELERQLLSARGYEVEVSVDGMDAWSKLRDWPCELVITDVDMPRMDGIELTRSIKQDPKLRSLPVVIVSYRDRPEDRARGMEVRADAYLTKSDFQEHGFVDVVHGLIGDAEVSE
ncbi:MAG TPA: response regulator [Xanthomonadaceae bacterium]|jgi:two-component system sensor histidine kinase and response regulator WspE